MNNFIKLLLISTLFLSILKANGQDSQLLEQKRSEIEKYENSLKKFKQENNNIQQANYLNQLGYIYWMAGYNKEAIGYFLKSVELNKIIGNKNAIKVINSNIGMLYSDMEQYDKSLVYLEKALEIEKKAGKKKQIATSINNITLVLTYMGKYNEAITKLEKSLEIAHGLNDLKLIRSCYAQLADNYKKLGDTPNWDKNKTLFTDFDRIIKERKMVKMQTEATKKIANANADKYKKQIELDETIDSLKNIEQYSKEQKMYNDLLKNKIMLREKEQAIEKQKDQLKTEKIIRYSLIGLFVFVIFFALMILRENRQKKKANKQLASQNILLEEQNDKLKIQKGTIENQQIDLKKSFEELAVKNKQITDSIEYARKIQEAILPSKKAIRENIQDSFIFYRPRDVVSGDFYWFSKVDNKLFIAAVDCTGHSVPGAFMSMIGNTLLNEIVNEKKIHKPSEVLEHLNAGVVFALNQEVDFDNEDEIEDISDDGMDITFYCIDKEKKEIQVACANHITYIITNNELKAIQGDFNSIGGLTASREGGHIYSNHTFEINSETTIYLFSDGYQDQFGGEKNKKFLSSRLKELLFENHKADMQDQNRILESTFEKWKGNRKQIDDVLIIGVKIYA